MKRFIFRLGGILVVPGMLMLATAPVFAGVAYFGVDGVRSNIFQSNSREACVSCHSSSLAGVDRNSAPVEVNFNTYALATETSIYGHHPTRARNRITEGTMPVAGPLNAAEQALITAWVANGNPDYAVPTANTQTAISISKYGATLRSSVNAGGSTSASFFFRYSTSEATVNSNGGTATTSQSASSSGGGVGTTDTLTRAISGLSCGTTYYFRAHGSSSQAGAGNGITRSFTTSACPSITSSAPLSVDQGQSYSYQATANNGGTIWSLDTHPAGMTISGGGLVSWNVPADFPTGNTPVTVRVSDGTSSATQSFNINVLFRNYPPEITSTPVTAATQGFDYSYDVNATDPDGDTLTYSLIQAPDGMTINSGTGLINWSVPADFDSSPAEVTVQVSDGDLTDSQNYSINVTTFNFPPEITSSPVTSAVQGQPYGYPVVAEDPDGDVLTYSLVTAPPGMSINTSSGQISWSVPPDFPASAEVTVRVSDGEFTDQQTFTISVEERNYPPVITSDPVTEAVQGQPYVYEPTAVDPDGDEVSWVLLQGPPGMTINGNSGRLDWSVPPDFPASVEVEIQAADGGEDGASPATQAFVILVETRNYPPVLTSIPDQWATELDPFSYQAQATDPDGDDLSWALLSAPQGMTIDPDTGLISWTPAIADLGGWVTVEVRDGLEDGVEPVTTEFLIRVHMIDTDGDGIPDAVELHHGLDPDDPTDAGHDLSGDGQNNLDAWLACLAEQDPGVFPPEDPFCESLALDTVPPEIDAPPVVYVATGPVTEVELAVTAEDFRDGPVPATTDHDGLFTPGQHEVTWQATDQSGNLAEEVQVVDIWPLIYIGGGQQLDGRRLDDPGYLVRVPLRLAVPALPAAEDDAIEVAYVVLDAQGMEVLAGSTEIDEGVVATELVFALPSSATVAGSDFAVALTHVEGQGVLDTDRVHRLSVIHEDIPPELDIRITQDGRDGRVVYRDGGVVTIEWLVSGDGPFTFDWSGTTDDITMIFGAGLSTATFNPLGVSQGIYPLQVRVSGGIEQISRRTSLLVRENAPTEGLTDTSGNGMPDFLSPTTDPSRLAAEVPLLATAEQLRRQLVTDAGLRLVAGESSLVASRFGSRIASSEAGLGQAPLDTGFSMLGHAHDFEVHGLRPGFRTARVVVPLPQAIPAGAVYRKYGPSGWHHFMETASDRLHSAKRLNNGYCPAPDSEQHWRDGLRQGDSCVRLTLTDGGPNDASGRVNGVIVDPGGVAVVSEETPPGEPPTRSPDERAGILGLLFGLFVLLMVTIRRRGVWFK